MIAIHGVAQFHHPAKASKTARLDAAGRPAFLETATPRNVPLYARHGFETVAEYTPAPGAPLVWAMWREPHAG
jgi:hypothetical protein